MEKQRVAVLGLSVDALSDGDLFGLRLAGQVLGHKASLAGHPHVARWFADFEAAIATELARRGVGVVLAVPPELALHADADADDRRLLADYLALLVANDGLSDAQRELCRRLLERAAA